MLVLIGDFLGKFANSLELPAARPAPRRAPIGTSSLERGGTLGPMEAQHAALGLLGQPCTPAWTFKPPGTGFDYKRALWAQAFQSTPIAQGTLKLPTGDRTFRIICDGQTAVVHPDDAGWLVRAVEPLMTKVKPIWAQAASNRTLPGGITVNAGLFPWLPKQWTCPECWPRIDKSGACMDYCTITKIYGGRMDGVVALYGYDDRAMRLWTVGIDKIPECNKNTPGGPDTLCMPVDGFCKLSARAVDYIRAFWQDVAQAVAAYNANPPPRPASPPAKPKPAVAPKPVTRDVNWLPLLAFGLATGLLGVFMWNRR